MRPTPPHDAPDGFRWEAVTAGADWRLTVFPRPCRYMQDRRSCKAPSVAQMLRGSRRQTWWAYCPDHMFGRWAEDGRVMSWRLAEHRVEVDADE